MSIEERLIVAFPIVLTISFLFLFFVFPVIVMLFYSFTDSVSILKIGNFIGLNNYMRVVTDSIFQKDLYNNIIYAIGSTSIQLLLGTGIAFVFNENFKFRNICRAIAILPYMLPSVAACLIWSYMLNPAFGIVNYVFGIDVNWFGNPMMAMLSVIMVSVWMWTPFVTMCMLAALQTIPLELYDAAKVDGASVLQRCRYIIFPHIKNILLIVIMLRGMWMFSKFDVIWLMTRGGPLGGTETLPILLYRRTMLQFSLGEGTSIAGLMLILMASTVYIYIKLTKMVG